MPSVFKDTLLHKVSLDLNLHQFHPQISPKSQVNYIISYWTQMRSLRQFLLRMFRVFQMDLAFGQDTQILMVRKQPRRMKLRPLQLNKSPEEGTHCKNTMSGRTMQRSSQSQPRNAMNSEDCPQLCR